MSQENVEIVRQASEAFNRRDVDGVLKSADRDVVWDWSRAVGPERKVFRGRDEVGAVRQLVVGGLRRIRSSPSTSSSTREITSSAFSTAASEAGAAESKSRAPARSWSGASETADFARRPSTKTAPRPSKPWGCRSRRCRARGILSRPAETVCEPAFSREERNADEQPALRKERDLTAVLIGRSGRSSGRGAGRGCGRSLARSPRLERAGRCGRRGGLRWRRRRRTDCRRGRAPGV